jgi:hypothetical protein
MVTYIYTLVMFIYNLYICSFPGAIYKYVGFLCTYILVYMCLNFLHIIYVLYILGVYIVH